MDGKRVLAGVGVALALVSTSACGKASDTIAEKATEKAIEQSTGGDVDIDAKDGKVKISGKDGDITYESDGDGNVKISGKDGESTYDVGDSAELPDGWPKALALPKGSEILASSSSASPSGEGKTLMVNAGAKGKVKDIYEDFKSALEDAGFTIEGDSVTSTDGSEYASLSAKSDDTEVTVSVMTGSDDGTVTMSLSAQPLSS